MKFLFAFSILVSLPTFAARFADDVRSIDLNRDEVSVTFKNHAQVHRFPASSSVMPCLKNGYLAKKPVDVTVSDESGAIVDCKLAPRMHPGAAGM